MQDVQVEKNDSCIESTSTTLGVMSSAIYIGLRIGLVVSDCYAWISKRKSCYPYTKTLDTIGILVTMKCTIDLITRLQNGKEKGTQMNVRSYPGDENSFKHEYKFRTVPEGFMKQELAWRK